MIIKVNPILTLIVFSVVPFIVLFAIIRRKGMRNAFKKMRQETGFINAQVESSVSGIRVAKAYTTEEYEVDKFDDRNEEFKKARTGGIIMLIATVCNVALPIYSLLLEFQYGLIIIIVPTILLLISTFLGLFSKKQLIIAQTTQSHQITNDKKFCPYCGKQLNITDDFCFNCGKKQ